MHRHPPLGHGGRPRRARRDRRGPNDVRRAAVPDRRAAPPARRRPEPDTVLDGGSLIDAVEVPPPLARRPVGVPQGARPCLVRVRAGSVARRARRGRRHGPRRPAGARRGRAEAVARPPRRSGPARRPAHRAPPPSPSAVDAELVGGDAAARQRVQGPARAPRSVARHAAGAGSAMSVIEDRPAARTGGTLRPGSTGPDKVTGRGSLRLRAHAGRRRLRRARDVARSPRAASCGSTPPRPWRSPGRAGRPHGTPTPRGCRGRDDLELAVLQSPDVAYRGQIVAVVVATTLEVAREARRAADRSTTSEPSTTSSCARDHPRLYAPDHVNPAFPTDTADGDVDAALAAAAVAVDVTYTTPDQHNNPMEPHATVAWWDGERLTVHDSMQGTARTRAGIAAVFGIDEADVHVVYPVRRRRLRIARAWRDRTPSWPRSPPVSSSRPVKLAVTRQQMFAITGYRTPTIQRLRLGAAADGTLTRHRPRCLGADLDAEGVRRADRRRHPPHVRRTEPPHHPSPGRPRRARRRAGCARRARRPACSPSNRAMDELALALGLDPVELRLRNEPALDPESGRPFSSPAPRRLPSPRRKPVRLGAASPPGAPPRRALGRSAPAWRRRSTRRGRSRRRPGPRSTRTAGG